MNKVWLKRIIILVICAGLIGMAAWIGFEVSKDKKIGKETVELSLDQLQNEDSYQFAALEWGMSPEEVGALLQYGIKASSQNADTRKNNDYRSGNRYALAGQSSEAYFRFETGRLKMVQFAFVIEEGGEEWFQARVDELKALYGAETEKVDLTDAGYAELSGTTYRWDLGDTALQINILYGGKMIPTVNIAVAATR